MATLFLRRNGNALYALDEGGSEVAMSKTWKDGDVLRCEVSKPRNVKLHRKAFILLKIVFDATDNYPSVEALRNAMTVGAGYVDTIINPVTGETALTPKSWKFDKMDETEFSALYGAMIGVALHIVEGSTEEEFRFAVDQIAEM